MFDQDVNERTVKRVRFSNCVNANDVTYLAIVNDPMQVETNEVDYFSPTFTYHAFGKDEQIEGYDGLRIEILYNAFNFDAYVHIQYKSQAPASDNILEKLKSSLPSAFTTNKDYFLQALRTSQTNYDSPRGTLVSSYERCVEPHEKITTKSRVFDVYECPLDDNQEAQMWFNNLQMMSLWFIEGADRIDVSDPRWVVYMLYERISTKYHQPIGYITLFKFQNPLGRKIGAKIATETHRICQALIFPLYQRQHHCEQLLEYIYTQVQTNPNVYEVTVEDPVPGFTKLRDFIDTRHCIKHSFFSISPQDNPSDIARGTNVLTRQDIQAVQEVLKFTTKQVQQCYELLKFRFINVQDEIGSYKPYRLEVKKRLYKVFGEELETMGSSERKKAFLETEYHQLEDHYKSILEKVKSCCDV